MTNLCTYLPQARAAGAMENPCELRSESRHYRKLAGTVWDERTRRVLKTMAAEFDSLAGAIEAEQARGQLLSTPRSLEHV